MEHEPMGLEEADVCYHCELEIIGKTLKCRGCDQAFCDGGQCGNWVSIRTPRCEACDPAAIQRGSEKRLRLLLKAEAERQINPDG